MNNGVFFPENKPSSYYIGKRQEMLRFIPTGTKNILEVGCGAGVFGSMLKTQFNATVWGIEICDTVAEEARARLDKVIVTDIENDEISLPQKYFDCIVFNDILEHLKYPWIVLKKIAVHLKDEGYIVASIPNVRYFYNIKPLLKHKEWKYAEVGILDTTHLRFFTIKSIKEMFDTCGYHIVKIEGINVIKFPWKFRIFNWIMMSTFEDMRFLEFACVVQKITTNNE